eukprot:m.218785 g.218785  ORF g.218785 m.218785 type:complete len:605 (+) comp39904_c1_seq3:240-2054(+)
MATWQWYFILMALLSRSWSLTADLTENDSKSRQQFESTQEVTQTLHHDAEEESRSSDNKVTYLGGGLGSNALSSSKSKVLKIKPKPEPSSFYNKYNNTLVTTFVCSYNSPSCDMGFKLLRDDVSISSISVGKHSPCSVQLNYTQSPFNPRKSTEAGFKCVSENNKMKSEEITYSPHIKLVAANVTDSGILGQNLTVRCPLHNALPPEIPIDTGWYLEGERGPIYPNDGNGKYLHNYGLTLTIVNFTAKDARTYECKFSLTGSFTTIDGADRRSKIIIKVLESPKYSPTNLQVIKEKSHCENFSMQWSLHVNSNSTDNTTIRCWTKSNHSRFYSFPSGISDGVITLNETAFCKAQVVNPAGRSGYSNGVNLTCPEATSPPTTAEVPTGSTSNEPTTKIPRTVEYPTIPELLLNPPANLTLQSNKSKCADSLQLRWNLIDLYGSTKEDLHIIVSCWENKGQTILLSLLPLDKVNTTIAVNKTDKANYTCKAKVVYNSQESKYSNTVAWTQNCAESVNPKDVIIGTAVVGGALVVLVLISLTIFACNRKNKDALTKDNPSSTKEHNEPVQELLDLIVDTNRTVQKTDRTVQKIEQNIRATQPGATEV